MSTNIKFPLDLTYKQSSASNSPVQPTSSSSSIMNSPNTSPAQHNADQTSASIAQKFQEHIQQYKNELDEHDDDIDLEDEDEDDDLNMIDRKIHVNKRVNHISHADDVSNHNNEQDIDDDLEQDNEDHLLSDEEIDVKMQDDEDKFVNNNTHDRVSPSKGKFNINNLLEKRRNQMSIFDDAHKNSINSGKKIRKRTMLPCEHCGKEFDRPSLLTRHLRTHTGEKPHICDICSKGFSTSSSLNTHRRIHTGDKPHRCPTCNKCFTASSNLYYHRMTHNKEKPHKCHLCSKSFPTPGDLKSHMYVHDGSWPFKCPVCDRGFSKPTNLKNHMYIHTGDKPHKCEICDKHFALACNLRAHIRTHHEGGDSTISTNSNAETSSDPSSINALNDIEQQRTDDSQKRSSPHGSIHTSHRQQRPNPLKTNSPNKQSPSTGNSGKRNGGISAKTTSLIDSNVNAGLNTTSSSLLQQAMSSNQLLHSSVSFSEAVAAAAVAATNQNLNNNLLGTLGNLQSLAGQQHQFNQETMTAMAAAADLHRQIALANLHHQNQLASAAATNPTLNATFDLLLRSLLYRN